MDLAQFQILLQDDKWFFAVSFLGFAFLLLAWMVYIRIRIERKLKGAQKQINLLEVEVEIFRDRDRANLNTVRKVVDGIDDVVKRMKVALDDEEEKLKMIEVNRKELAESNSKNKKGI